MEDTIGLKNDEPRVMKQKSPSSFKVVAGQSERRKNPFVEVVLARTTNF